MVLVAGHDHCFVHGLFRLPDRHRSAALQGQHRDRKPQQKAKDRAHHPNMVPQIKRMHQGSAFGASDRISIVDPEFETVV
jgi:hypothetical protein